MADKLYQVMVDNGYYINIDEPTEELYFDSLQFISTIVGIESEFDITIPDMYLAEAKDLDCFEQYLNLVVSLAEAKNGLN